MRISISEYKNIPKLPGVYKFLDEKDKIIYIGKAINLKNRISSYFINKNQENVKISTIQNQAKVIEYTIVQSDFEALLLEAKLIKTYRPKLNIIWKDDRNYLYIKITKEKYPLISTSRKYSDKTFELYGPFPSAKITKEIVRFLRKIFPYCTKKLTNTKPCFYSHLKLCDPCPGYIESINDKNKKKKLMNLYLSNIRNIKNILKGNIHKAKHIIENQMFKASEVENFEDAAEYRDRLNKLNLFMSKHFSPYDYYDNPDIALDNWNIQHNKLIDLLSPYYRIQHISRIECYDISNISGKFASGSMVVFINGFPLKNEYRKFKIKYQKNSDFHMMEELIIRRFKHQEWLKPDLIIIDGGKPQLNFILKSKNDFFKNIPLIGIEKKGETIIIPSKNNFIRIKYNRNNSVLNLIQRLRDEAHRFAHNYHTHLRLKNIFE
jgi:excinuclease ABC subunit C